MIILEQKTYSKEEIFNLFSIDLKDTHGKRKLNQYLKKSFYDYDNSKTKEVRILGFKNPYQAIAETAKELGIYKNKNFNLESFSIFFYRMINEEEFCAMPWQTRTQLIQEQNNITINERSCQRWLKKMVNEDIFFKDTSNKVLWMTDSNKKQILVPEGKNNSKYKEYNKRRIELLKTMSWQGMHKILWEEYKVIYYYCIPYILNGIKTPVTKTLFDAITDYILNKLLFE